MKTCSVKECGGRVVALDLCNKHWTRFHKYGTTESHNWERRAWTDEEITILRDKYPQEGATGVAPLLPHRTKEAIKTRAFDLGLKFIGKLPGHPQYAVGISGKNDMLAMIHRRAKTRGNDLLISDEEIVRLSQLPCHYCGTEKSSIAGRGWGQFKYNGIDRLDSSQGYIPGNVVPCCRVCNRMKMDMPAETFLQQIRKIADHAHIKGLIKEWSETQT